MISRFNFYCGYSASVPLIGDDFIFKILAIDHARFADRVIDFNHSPKYEPT